MAWQKTRYLDIAVFNVKSPKRIASDFSLSKKSSEGWDFSHG